VLTVNVGSVVNALVRVSGTKTIGTTLTVRPAGAVGYYQPAWGDGAGLSAATVVPTTDFVAAGGTANGTSSALVEVDAIKLPLEGASVFPPVTFSGTAIHGSTVQVWDGATLLGSAVAAANSTWSIPVAAVRSGTVVVTMKVGGVVVASRSVEVFNSSDSFVGTGGLGANWQTIAGMSAPTKSNGIAVLAQGAGARWVGSTLGPDQYSSAGSSAGNAYVGASVLVRVAPGARTYYAAAANYWSDDVEYVGATTVYLYKVIDGVATVLATGYGYDYLPGGIGLSVSAHGNVISATCAGVSLSATDDDIADGAPGIAATPASVDVNVASAFLSAWSSGVA
jgi:hypothetical protein